MANRSGGTPTPTASWAFPLSLTSRQPPRNRPPAMLDMSEFPALGATPPPPSSTSSTVNHSHNDSVTAMSPSSTPNDQSHSIPAAAVVATTPTNTMMMMDGVGLSTSTTTSIVSPTPTSSLLMLGNPMVQQQQQHSHTISTSVSSTSTMATNHHAHTSIGSLPNAASLLSSSVGSLPINGAAHALHFGHSPVVPGASPASLSMANQQRKVGEFTLDDFPALGGSTTPSSDSQTLKPTGDRLPGSAPTSLHETSAAVVARRLNGVNDISDNSNNSTNTTDMSNDMTIRPISGSNSVIANGVWGSSDHHATLASRIMAAQANSQANNTAVSSNSNINSVTSTTTTTTTTTAPSSISHEKISTGLDVFNHSAVSPHTHPTPPLDTKNTMVTGTATGTEGPLSPLVDTSHGHNLNSTIHTASHGSTSSLLASLTASVSVSTPPLYSHSQLPPSLLLSHQSHAQHTAHHPLGASPAAPLMSPTPGLNNHNTGSNASGNGNVHLPTTPSATTTSMNFPMGFPSDPTQQWRLLALRDVIKSNGDLTMLHLGSDLTNLGINLNLGDPLYATVTSTVTEPCQLPVEPDYRLPPCYLVQPAPPAQQKMTVFSEETLFYIFYAMPQDILQDAAAQELYNRHWRYHKEHGVWLTKDATSLEPIQKTATHERGRFVIFDHHHWQRVTKETVIAYDALEERSNITNSAVSNTSNSLMGHNPLLNTPHGHATGIFSHSGGLHPSNMTTPTMVNPPLSSSNPMDTTAVTAAATAPGATSVALSISSATLPTTIPAATIPIIPTIPTTATAVATVATVAVTNTTGNNH